MTNHEGELRLRLFSVLGEVAEGTISQDEAVREVLKAVVSVVPDTLPFPETPPVNADWIIKANQADGYNKAVAEMLRRLGKTEVGDNE